MVRKSDYTLLLLGGILVAAAFFLFRGGSTVIIQDNPIKFSSTRKHPFDVFSDPYAPPER